MSGSTQIRAALVARLLAVPPGAALAASSIEWRNRKYTRQAGTRYYRITMKYGIPHAAAIGGGAPERNLGLFYIDILEPGGTGEEAAAAEAERIIAAYRAGTLLTSGGVNVYCRKAYRGATDESDPAWYMVQVVVEWRADVTS